MGTLQKLSSDALQRDAEGNVLEFEGRWYTRGELRSVADKVNALLEASGVAPNGPVCLISRNHPAVIAALLGLISQGRNIRMLYAFQSPAGILRDIARLQPAAFVLTAKDLSGEVATGLRGEGIATIVLDDMKVSVAAGLEKAGPVAAARTFDGPPQIEILTSGTTGPPKQFPLTYDMILKHHVLPGQKFPAGAGATDKLPPFLLYMPIGNISGIFTTMPALLNGARAQLLERFSISAWVEYVKKYRPAMHGVPPSMMQQLIDAKVPKEDLASLKSMG